MLANPAIKKFKNGYSITYYPPFNSKTLSMHTPVLSSVQKKSITQYTSDDHV